MFASSVACLDGPPQRDAPGDGMHHAIRRTGQPVAIRPARPGDEGALAGFYAGLCNETSRLRFFTVRRRIPAADLHRWTASTLPKDLVLLAFADDELLGIGELHRLRDVRTAEVAFAVADRHHGEGLATLLFEDLAAAALEYGMTRFVATTLHANRDMQLVFRTVGCPLEVHRDDDVTEVAVELDGDLLAAAHRRRAVEAALHTT